MPDYDAGFKIVARQAGRELTRLAGVECDDWEPISDTLQATERLADRAFRARVGRERFVVYMEAYTRWQPKAPWNLLAKSALLSEREELPTLTLVYVFLPGGYKPQNGQFRLTIAEAATQQLWFREMCLWQQEPQTWWDDAPALLPLYPLTRHGRSSRDAVVHAAQRIIERTPERILRADLLTTLFIFGKLASPDMNVLRIIGREQMKESKAYEEIMEEGELKARRKDVHEVIELRFGKKTAAEFREVLDAITNPDELSQLHRRAIRCRRPADLRRAVAK